MFSKPLFWRRGLRFIPKQWGLAPVFHIIAILLLALAVLMSLPLIALLIERNFNDARAFEQAIFITVTVSLLLLFLTRHSNLKLRPRQMFVLTVASWGIFAVFASLPLMLGSPQLSVADAIFESVSGVTSTGATVIRDLDHLSDGLKLWRGLLEWMGGIGIIVMAIAILPFLKVGGMRLFQTETSAWTERVLPRAGSIAKSIGIVYLVQTLLAISTYWLLGMKPIDAVVHAMTSVSTGGFANYDASFSIYKDQPAILWACVFFMISGALPFVLYIRLVTQKSMALFHDQQVRGFLKLVSFTVIVMASHRLYYHPAPFWSSVTETTFNVVSVLTTTGFATSDYNQWSPFAVSVFFYLLFIGGCSGSTTGGMKIFRFQVAIILLFSQIRRLVHPQGVFIQRYNGFPLKEDVIRAVVAFTAFFFFTVAAFSVALSLMGLDFITALSASVSILANTGPGLGEFIGPAGNYSTMPEMVKWLLSFAMLLGRLEILTVIVLLTPVFWRN